MQNEVMRTILGLLLCLLLLCGCYDRHEHKSEALVQYSERQLDSLSFQSTHHYTNNYNFVVWSDTLCLLRQQPEEMLSAMPTDSFPVGRNERLVVAEIRMMPTDSIDSVWVELATEQSVFGWTREKTLLSNVVPDDPVSQFISLFSDSHLLIFLVVISLIVFSYWAMKMLKRDAPLVHFRDIDSFYPTLLMLLVAASATLYASIQLFAPEMWRHFYYHPTLNPFSVPFMLGLFLSLVWAMLIVGIAACEDVFRQLRMGDALMYIGGLAAVAAFNYILFSLSTLYYVGYALLVVYVVFALWRYFSRGHSHLVCGRCGASLPSKGRCPQCGVVNK